MWDFCRLTWWVLVGLFRSRRELEAENLVLRQQINVLRRTAPKGPAFSSIDRWIFVGFYRLFPDVRDALAILRPETVIRWHRAGFRALCLPKIRSGGIGDAIRPKLAGTECARRPEQRAVSAHPCSVISVCAPR
jgi:hypothetical protein